MHSLKTQWNYFVTWTLPDWGRSIREWSYDLFWGITMGVGIGTGIGIGIGLALFAAVAHATPVVPVGHNMVAAIEIAQRPVASPTGDAGSSGIREYDISEEAEAFDFSRPLTEDEVLATVPLFQEFPNDNLLVVPVDMYCPDVKTVAQLAAGVVAENTQEQQWEIFNENGCISLPRDGWVAPVRFYGWVEDGDGGSYIWGFKVGDQMYFWSFYKEISDHMMSVLSES